MIDSINPLVTAYEVIDTSHSNFPKQLILVLLDVF